MQISQLAAATWESLTAAQRPELATPIERADIKHHDTMQRHWRENGFVVLDKFLPDDLIDAYCAVRERLPKAPPKGDRSADFLGGWSFPTPFMICPELRDLALYPPLMRAQFDLIGFPMAMNLALTGWVSTERKWHQDAYLNPPELGAHYIAAWMALDDVSEESGPFEFVAGSHLWPVLQRDKLFAQIPAAWRTSPHWPTWTQDDVARVCEEEITRRNVKISKFLPKRGDVLLWHAHLMHRGSDPTRRDVLRKALICHYSSVAHRCDMRDIRRHDNGSLYFVLPVDGNVRPMS
jgi:hypothetical protein